MTAQIAEVLRYHGMDVTMCSEPLGDYFAMGGRDPGFESNCTALWRGYVGRWEIVDRRLYLIELSGTLMDGTSASVATIFPDFPDRVFAHWYTGTIRIPQGREIEYVHAGYGSIYERDLLIEVERGVVVATRERQNGMAESDNTREGYSSGAMTLFSRDKREPGIES